MANANHAEIVDKKLLRSVLERVRDQFPTQRPAAKALRISQGMFSKLLNEKNKRISFGTYQNILAALHDRAEDSGSEEDLRLESDFVRSVLTYAGWHVQQRYNTWLYREIERLARVLPVFLELWKHPDYKLLFEKFLHRTGLPPPQDRRLWIALLRVIEPLGVAEEVWGMERSWQDLHEAGKLKIFLKRGLKIERARLHRPRDFEQLSKCSNPNYPPQEYIDALTGEDMVLDRNEIEHLEKSGVRDLE